MTSLYLIFAFTVGVCIILGILISLTKSSTGNYKYKKTASLFTNNELKLYQALVTIAHARNLQVFGKVRIADLLEPREKRNWQAAFNKIQAKHIDFVLCDQRSLKPILAIELDDKTHQRPDRIQRDQFVDHAFKTAGFPILHVNNNTDLAKKIDTAINKK